MADNVTLNNNTTTGQVLATDDISSVHYQRVKLADGTADSATVIASGNGTATEALRVTVASDSTGTLTVSLSATDNQVLDDIKAATEASQTALEVLDNAISGSEMQVDVVASLPAGSNSIGNIGVINTSITPGTSAGHLGKAEDAAHASGDTGVAVLAVRNDSVASLSGTDGDYSVLQVDSNGRLYVEATISGTVDLGATDNAVLDSIATATAATQAAVETIDNAISGSEMQVDIVSAPVMFIDDNGGSITIDSSALNSVASVVRAEDDPFSSGVAGNVILGVRQDTLASSTTADGDYSIFKMNEEGALYVEVAAGSAGSTQYAEDAAHSSGDTGTMVLGVRADSDGSLSGTDGDYSPLQVDDNGYLKVNIKAGAGSGGTASTDDAAFTVGSGSGTPAMGIFSTDTVDSGDVGVLAMDASRRLLVSIEADNAGIGGGTQYVADAVAPATPTGNALMAERDDALGGITPAEGDWTQLFADADGALWVKHSGDITIADGGNTITVDGTVGVSGTVTVDGSGVTQPVSGTVTANLSATDNAVLDNIETATAATQAAVEIIDNAISGSEMQVDIVAALPPGSNSIGNIGLINTSVTPGTSAAHLGKAKGSAGGATDTGVMMLAVRDDVVSTLSDAEGDYVPLLTDDSGRLHVNLGGTAGNTLGVVGGGAEATALRVTIANDSTGVVSIDDNGGSLTVDGTVSISGTVTVGSHAVTNAGTFAVQVDGAALTALQLLDNTVVTEDAAAAANPTGNMMMTVRDDEVGSTAIADADGDVQAARSDMFGALKVTNLSDATSEVQHEVIDDATSGNNTIVTAAGAGTKIRVLSLFMVATGDVLVRFESNAGGTALTGQMDLTTNSGIVLPHNPYGWFETGDNELLNLELDGAVSVDGALTYVEV